MRRRAPFGGGVLAAAAATAVLLSPSWAQPARAQPQAEPPPPPATTPPPPPATTSTEDLTPAQRYRRGKGMFEYGECTAAVDTLAPLAVPGLLQDDASQLDVHRMLGVCYALATKPIEAAREFSSMLSIDPDANLDPFLTPPNAIEIFDKQKAAMKARLEELRIARDKAKQDDFSKGGVIVEKTTTIQTVPIAVAFMPFGLAQAANGETVKAVVAGSVQGLFAAGAVSLFWTSMALNQNKDQDGTEEGFNAYQTAVAAQLISILGFTAAYGVGVADALWSREDGAVVDKKTTRRKLTAAEIKALKKVEPAPPPAPAPVPELPAP